MIKKSYKITLLTIILIIIGCIIINPVFAEGESGSTSAKTWINEEAYKPRSC